MVRIKILSDVPSFTASPLDYPDRDLLLNFLRQHFPTHSTRIAIGDLSLDFVSIADPHDQIDLLMGQQVDEDYQWEPFWAQAWPSAQSLTQWMVSHRENGQSDAASFWSGRKVLDLGCGVGLCGCVAAALGARVTFADYAAPSLYFAALNAWPWKHRVQTQIVDWHRDQLPEKFDLILGADIVYEQRNWESLDRFLNLHMHQDSQAWLTEPGRDTGTAIQDFLLDRRWRVQSQEIGRTDHHRAIRLLQVTKTAS